MLLWLLTYLSHSLGWKIPAAFFYISTRMLLASGTSLLLTIFLGPLFIKKLYEWKIGQPIRTVGEVPLLAELHGKKKDTPTMGGVLLVFSMLFSLLVWMDLSQPCTWVLLVVTLSLGFLGGMDDYLKLRYKNSRGISSRKKLVVQGAVSLFVAWYMLGGASPQIVKEVEKPSTAFVVHDFAKRIYVPFCKKPIVLPTILAVIWIFFVITGASNAVNLTDGLDGLAAGCLVMAAVVLGIVGFLSNHIEIARYLQIPYIEGSGEIAIYLLSLAGACLGFLWYNGYPAQVFMGDTGSLALGGVLGAAAVLLKKELLLAIAGGIFVLEALSVISQVLSYRYRGKKRIFLCAPLHHHFEYKGWPETKVVLRFWILSLLFAIVALSSLKLQ